MHFLYVHMPFCAQKCNYCDFVSFPCENAVKKAYIDLLLSEAELYKADAPEDGLLTIFLGGGTPSLVESGEIIRLLDGLKNIFGFAPKMEITIEANPETVTRRYLKQLSRCGINRISFGAQAFQDHHLKAMGRRHTVADIQSAVENAVDVGINNVNIDLIYGLPGQTQEEWKDSLTLATKLPVTHISTYGLKLHDTTPWGRAVKEGKLTLPPEDVNADMQLYAMDYLDNNGFPRYEISNFAKLGYPCRHNTAYWIRKDYLGLGLNAASLKAAGTLRTVNEPGLKKYTELLSKGEKPIGETENLTTREIYEEELFLPLRTIWGLDINTFTKKYGTDYFAKREQKLVALFDAGLIVFENGFLKLTNKGVLLNNEVITELL